MRRILGAKKKKDDPPPSIQEASDRINKRGENVDDKIRKLEAELARYGEQIRKTRPGHTQDALKARAMRVLKQKRMYEGQRDLIYDQTFNLEQISFAAEGLKDAQQTMSALKSANTELKGIMKNMKISDIDSMQDEMMDMVDETNEIQESLGRSYNVPDYVDEEELMGELGGLEEDMEMEIKSDAMPSYLLPDNEPELNLPTAPSSHVAPPVRHNAQMEDEFGLPSVPRASSLRG